MRLARSALMVSLLAMGPVTSGASELVVIASTDPAVKIGRVIDGKESLQVAAGASVVLLSSAGRRIVLDGPYGGAPQSTATPSNNRIVESLSKLISGDVEATEKLAAFRGADGSPPAQRPDLWGVDIAHAGTYCLPSGREAALWWDGARSGALTSLSGPAGNAREARIRWPSGRRHMPWPRELGIVDGATYVVRFRATGPGIELKILRMPPLETPAERAAWMAEHGCTRQALEVVDAIARGELEPRH